MSAKTKDGGPGEETPFEAPFDAEDYLRHMLPREPGDVVKVTRIPDTHSYRVNWYDARKTDAHSVSGMSIAYIRKSLFVHCQMGPDGRPIVGYPHQQ